MTPKKNIPRAKSRISLRNGATKSRIVSSIMNPLDKIDALANIVGVHPLT